MVASLGGFRTFRSLKRSEAFMRRKQELSTLLGQPRIYCVQDAVPRLRSFLRVVHWNIQYGLNLEAIIAILNTHPLIRFADLILLNEVDDGMLRSGNVNVAQAAGSALSAHAIFGVEYLELTSGPGRFADLSGSNKAALHGNAILTRHPFSRARILRLPRCEDNFESAERRIGGRAAVTAEIGFDGSLITASSTHLDVAATPRCRAKQMLALLDRASVRGPTIVGGDLNTHTFARGGKIRSIGNILKVLFKNRERLNRDLANPAAREPVLSLLNGLGLMTEGFNDALPTSSIVLSDSSLTESTSIPAAVRRLALRRLRNTGMELRARLDWFAARGLRPLGSGEAVDRATGTASIPPQTIRVSVGGAPISDHLPIVVDVVPDEETMNDE